MVDIDKSVIEVAFVETPRQVFAPDDRPHARAESGEGTAPDTDAGSRRSVEGRLAVVTGASGLLGAAFVADLVGRGANVCLVGRDLDALRDTAAGLGPDARTALLRCDLASAEDVDSACDFIDRIGAPVDLVVHAAGIYSPTSIARGTVEDLDEHYLLDVRGPYLLTQRLLPSLIEARGRVVFLAGPERPADADRDGPAADVHRSISQAGLRAFAGQLRAEAAPSGVRVLTVGADDELDSDGAGPDGAAFLRACAATVMDTLAVDTLDVTELRVRRGSRVARTERR